jgi:hypothetical protein
MLVVQVPALLLHEWQGVVQLSAQQVLSTQLPLAHSGAPPQVCPLFFLHLLVASQVLLPVQLLGSSASAMPEHLPGVA